MHKMKKILIVACLCLFACEGRVELISSDGTTNFGSCFVSHHDFSECAIKTCPNGFDILAGSGTTDSTSPIFKCKPIPKPCPEIK